MIPNFNDKQEYATYLLETMNDILDLMKDKPLFLIMAMPMLEDDSEPGEDHKIIDVSTLSNMTPEMQENLCLMHMQYARDKQDENTVSPN